jgi:hypothetical protein
MDSNRLLENIIARRKNTKAKVCRSSSTEKVETKRAQISAQTQENMLSGAGGKYERTAVGAQPPLVQNPIEGADNHWRVVEEMDKYWTAWKEDWIG